METKNKITIKEIKEQVVMPALESTSFRYKVFTNVGEYRRSATYKNFKLGFVNALMETTDSDIALLGGGIQAVAMNIRITFLIPVDDTDLEGEYPISEKFRDQLSNALSTAERIQIKSSEGTTYIGAMSVGLPMGGQLLQRQGIGKSFEYTCYLEIAFLENAINSSDILFYFGEDTTPIPCTTFSFNRKNTLTANLLSQTSSQESKTFAENSTFGVDLSMPAIAPNSGSAIGDAVHSYLMGETPANTPYELTIKINGTEKEFKETVIFGEVVTNGGGTENVAWQVSFVPYMPAEDE